MPEYAWILVGLWLGMIPFFWMLSTIQGSMDRAFGYGSGRTGFIDLASIIFWPVALVLLLVFVWPFAWWENRRDRKAERESLQRHRTTTPPPRSDA